MGTGLAWGVKSSFVRYVSSMGGAEELEDGAVLTRDGEYYFGLADQTGFDPEARLGVLQFRGTVHFSGHAGLLDVRIVDPRITMTSEGAVMSVETGAGPASRIDLVALVPGDPVQIGEVLLWRGVPTWLASAATPLFNDAYRPGEMLDPLSFRVVRAASDA